MQGCCPTGPLIWNNCGGLTENMNVPKVEIKQLLEAGHLGHKTQMESKMKRYILAKKFDTHYRFNANS